ncbi:MAG: amidohydrolase family protein [Victivallales bacterium]|nr:amidohydrolase family protein [Victivallales bacterium]
MIIDIHTHNTLADAASLLEAAARNGVEKAVLLGDVLRFGNCPVEKQVRKLNDDTIAAVEKFPGKTYGFCFLNPANDLDFTLKELDRCICGHAFKGVKLEVSVNCRDKRLQPLMRKLDELKVPLLQHCWYKTVNKYPEESDPSDVACLARQFPSVKIIMAHLTGCGHRGVEDIAECSNVYIDTSGGQPVSGLVEYAVRKLGPERVLFGSDAPGRDIACQLGRIYGAKLDEESRRKILCDNAKELLNL